MGFNSYHYSKPAYITVSEIYGRPLEEIKIPGLPGVRKIIAFRPPKGGEHYIAKGGVFILIASNGEFPVDQPRLILSPIASRKQFLYETCSVEESMAACGGSKTGMVLTRAPAASIFAIHRDCLQPEDVCVRLVS